MVCRLLTAAQMNEAACVCLGWCCANAYTTGRSERRSARAARTARTGAFPILFLAVRRAGTPERVGKPEPVRHVRSPLAKQARYYFSTLGILDIVYVARKYFFDSFFGTAPLSSAGDRS
jgi:hypothetical protein